MHVHNNAEDPRHEPGALWGLNLCLQGEAGSLDPVLKLMKPNIRLSDSTLKTFEPFCGLFYDALRAPENKEGFFFLVLSVCRTSGLPSVQVLRSWFSPAAFTWQVRRRRLGSVVHDELKAKPQPQLKHIREEYIRILCTTRTWWEDAAGLHDASEIMMTVLFCMKLSSPLHTWHWELTGALNFFF